ncbi:MAG: type II toxin-antitoxin system CcdA family antitoxin [Thermofilaceae archaeon]
MEYVTVSARVNREIWEKAKRYGINVSEVIRRALEREVKSREVEWAVNVMDDIARRAQLDKPSWQIIREHREKL